jgi:hypothetical protein
VRAGEIQRFQAATNDRALQSGHRNSLVKAQPPAFAKIMIEIMTKS